MTPPTDRSVAHRDQPAPAWFAPLADAVHRADGAPAALAAVFEHLRREVGPDEAGRRWWAVFAEADATHT